MFAKMVFFFAIVTLLSFCSPASSFAFLPRVFRTDDAIVIDLDGIAPSYQGKTLYGQIDDPSFVLLPSFYPVPMTYRQVEHSSTPNGWIYSYGYSTPLTLEDDVLPVRQSPAPVCGTGPATMPATRELTSERIAGRISAKKVAWPFIVALRNNIGSLFCTGSLISDTRVLLAAQCLEKMSLFEFSGVTVLVGMYSADQSDVQMTRRISKMFLHRQYNAATYANDIAIIVMDAPVILSRTVAPVCLPPASADPDQFVDQDAVAIAGYGIETVKTTTTVRNPDGTTTTTIITVTVQQAKVSIWSNADCKTDPTVGRYVTDNTTCITSAAANRFTCPTDVGGPIVMLPSPGTWTIVGINSYTKDCNSNGLKTRVSAFRAWIDTYMIMA